MPANKSYSCDIPRSRSQQPSAIAASPSISSSPTSSYTGSAGSPPQGHQVHKLSTASKMAANLGNTMPDPLTQRAVLEGVFERRLVEGEFWYVVVAEWLEQLKKYLGIPSSRKFYHQRVHPGPIIVRRDYAHTVEMLHEDAWKLVLQWYGLCEGQKPTKLVVFNYTRAPEIEHNLNNCKLMLTKSVAEDFHNVKYSKMEKVGHVEWKLRNLYNIGISSKSRLWAKPDSDGDWRPLLVRDQAIGKVLDIESDFTRPIFALEVIQPNGTWSNEPENAKPTQDCPIGILYDHDIFEDITSTWELDIHDQIDHIGRDFIDRLHINFSGFVQKAKDYVEERDGILRERERKVSSKEAHLDGVRDDLLEEKQRAEQEVEAYLSRQKLYEEKLDKLEAEYELKFAQLEAEGKKKKGDMDAEHALFTKAKENFDLELKRMSSVYKIQENKIKLDIGGQIFTTSLLTLTKDQDSMFSAMFSGRHKLRQEQDGSYFIDRDGAHFRYILNYLRDGCIKEGTLPSNEAMWGELMNEAEYYQLNGLVEYLRGLTSPSRNVSRSSSTVDVLEDTT